jgi:uncharacterized protein YihD (DUF1040 family)
VSDQISELLSCLPVDRKETRNEVKFYKCGSNAFFIFNMSYLTDSYIVFTLKMESVSKNTIFGLKMIVKSGLEKFILKSLHAGVTEFVILGIFMK